MRYEKDNMKKVSDCQYMTDAGCDKLIETKNRIPDAAAIIMDQITYWENYFVEHGSYPEGYSPELSDAMEVIVEAAIGRKSDFKITEVLNTGTFSSDKPHQD